MRQTCHSILKIRIIHEKTIHSNFLKNRKKTSFIQQRMKGHNNTTALNEFLYNCWFDTLDIFQHEFIYNTHYQMEMLDDGSLCLSSSGTS